MRSAEFLEISVIYEIGAKFNIVTVNWFENCSAQNITIGKANGPVLFLLFDSKILKW